VLPLLRDKAARYVCHSPYARDPYDQLSTVPVASCAHTPSSWYRCSSTTMQPCTSCLSPCAHTPTQAVLRCLSGVMRARTEAACAAAPQQRRRPVHRVSQHLCTCTSIRAVPVASCAHTPEQLSLLLLNDDAAQCGSLVDRCAYTQTPGPALSLYRHARAHRSSMCCRSYATTQPEAACAAAPQQRRRPEQHVLPTLNDGATRRVLYLWRHAHIHRSSWSCCPSQRTGTACLSPRAHTPIREAVR
jgi:hypothetical protein